MFEKKVTSQMSCYVTNLTHLPFARKYFSRPTENHNSEIRPRPQGVLVLNDPQLLFSRVCARGAWHCDVTRTFVRVARTSYTNRSYHNVITSQHIPTFSDKSCRFSNPSQLGMKNRDAKGYLRQSQSSILRAISNVESC